jgi:anaerobic magnesium-protoporphyrin IX monomethyl ester cyclase
MNDRIETGPSRIESAGHDRMIDCLLIGFNDYRFPALVEAVAAGGRDSGAFQDLRLSYVDYDGEPRRALDILTRFRREAAGDHDVDYHNSDFLWPVITYLGSFLHRHGFTFDYVNLFHKEKERLAELLSSGRVRSVAITTTLYVAGHPIKEIVDFVRGHAPDVKIIVGGPYVANLAAEAARDGLGARLRPLGADYYVVSREGELTLTRILARLRDGAGMHEVPNVVFHDGTRIVRTVDEVESNSIADNMVNYHLFPDESFNEFVTTRTGKSCPFSCSFCGFPQRAGKYTYLDLEHVERELDAIAKIPGVNTITFIDDTFNVPKVRFRELCQLMIDKGYGFKWNCYYRSDHGDRRTVELMRDAGCEGVFLGIESGSDPQLKRMNKTARRHHYLAALADLRDAGISTYGSLIIGFPGETDETVADTVDLLREGRPDFFRAQLWYADPVTPIWEQREQYGIKGRGFTWRHDTMDAAEACRHIERMFMTIDEPIWMPQFGFEQWSTFYLQRRGFTMGQVKSFLRAFNAVVRDQVQAPAGSADSDRLIQELKAACACDAAPRETTM